MIDFHTHLTGSAHTVHGVALGAARVYNAPPACLLPVMESMNLLALVNFDTRFWIWPAIKQVSRFAERVEPKQRIDIVKDDPDDDRILECAVAGQSDYLR